MTPGGTPFSLQLLEAGDVRQHPVENQWLYNIVHYNNNKKKNNSDHYSY